MFSDILFNGSQVCFGVKAPTAHKILSALQSKEYQYFGRDSKSGFFIRLIERAGSAEIVMEVPFAGKVSALGEVIDFPKEFGHFASVFVGAAPETVFALVVSEDIPQASILAGAGASDTAACGVYLATQRI